MSVQVRRESIPVILQKINDAEDVLEALKEHKDDVALKNIFGYSFIPRGKFLLPEGQPPYNQDAAPMDLNVSHLAFEAPKFDKFIRTDLTQVKREQLYIQLLESLHKSEADLMLHIKDQTLNEVYPKIELDKIVDAGFFSWPEGIDREEYNLKRFQAEVQKLKKELPKPQEVESLEQNSGTQTTQKKSTRGRPKKSS